LESENVSRETLEALEHLTPIDNIIDYLREAPTVKKRENKQTIELFNVACAFDIETTSFYVGETKQATMYLWQFAVNDMVCVGRTWEEWITLSVRIQETLNLSPERRLVIYVHNLSYEFQFMCKLFNWTKVFAIDSRKPVYAINSLGLEYRCSYLLSGYSLAKLAENLTTSDIRKLVGDLDYTLPRHSETPLTATELSYGINDVLIVTAYINEKISQDGGIHKMCITKTGYVRKFIKKNCYSKKNYKYYRGLMEYLTLRKEEYYMLKRAFQGGFTHANAYYSGKSIGTAETDDIKVSEGVTSYDFTSSYPAVFISEKFPMSQGRFQRIHSIKELEELIPHYCMVFDVRFTNINQKVDYESYISYSHCSKAIDPIINNGRIYSAKQITTTITEVDYHIIKAMYNYDKIEIGRCICYKKGYLPKPIIESILTLYRDKTQLKDVAGKEVEYLASKELLNACFGMMVTDIVRDENIFDEEWITKHPDPATVDELIDQYNNSHNRTLFYPWGIYCTAYARRNLFTGIMECKNDYIYSDTDSIKIINPEAHKPYIEKYNRIITRKIQVMCDTLKIDYSMTCPKTIEGKSKPLGVWDYDGHFQQFKTLGAKRYIYQYDNLKWNLTVSGVNKKSAIPYLYEKYGDRIIDKFADGLHIPEEATGKLLHTYIDTPCDGILRDYLGNLHEYHEKSFIHLEGTTYDLGISNIYNAFLNRRTLEK
jgi:hypothetical protein